MATRKVPVIAEKAQRWLCFNLDTDTGYVGDDVGMAFTRANEDETVELDRCSFFPLGDETEVKLQPVMTVVVG
jgi:hypothetical protein